MQVVQSPAAVFDRPLHADPAALGELGVKAGVMFARPALHVGEDVRGHLGACEGANLFAETPVLIAEFEIHGWFQ
ncbi:MAG: hypothetical protein A3G27_07300 [Betaproteobacteria bacterium RIFCSPLOWO2_12_FULL_66_14]|nr:MAG: hypothetical protein A3G27_07300 [Betaproteobacteria bacterium RIFCSPLOWO2_12_FULL_66_14]